MLGCKNVILMGFLYINANQMLLKSLYIEVHCPFVIYEIFTAVGFDVAKVTFLFCSDQNNKVFWCLDYSFWKV